MRAQIYMFRGLSTKCPLDGSRLVSSFAALVVFSGLVGEAADAASRRGGAIESVDFKSYLLKRNHLGAKLLAACRRAPLIQDIVVSYGQVAGLTGTLAVVEASSCAMGNGGSDIVEIFRASPGGPESLRIDDSGLPANAYEGERRTPRLEILKGKLTRWFIRRDDAGSDAPEQRREIGYRWNGDRFVVDGVRDIAEAR